MSELTNGKVPPDQADDNSCVGFLPNTKSLGAIVSDLRLMLDSLESLTQPRLVSGDSGVKNLSDILRSACDELEPLIGGGGCGERATALDAGPQMLVLGQPKCGKSSLINELLGRTTLKQSQSTSFIPDLTRLRYCRPQSLVRSDEGCRDAEKALSSVPVVELRLLHDLLKQSGLEILDSPGSHEFPPVYAWGFSATAPAVIVYVIDALSGITREVETDINEIKLRFANSQLIFVLNKMDASADVALAAGVTQETAESAMRERVLAGLQRLGCRVTSQFPEELQEAALSQASSLVSSTLDSPNPFPESPLAVSSLAKHSDKSFTVRIPCQLFCLSCRQLKAFRRARLPEFGACANSGRWQETLCRLRGDISNGVGLRLRRLVSEVADRLDRATQIFGVLEDQLHALDEDKKQAWDRILVLHQNAFKYDDTRLSISIIERIVKIVKQRKMEIRESVLLMTEHLDDSKKGQVAAVSEIERLVLSIHLKLCQDFAHAEIESRLAPMEDLLASLSDFLNPLTTHSVPCLDREYTIDEGLEFATLNRAPSKREGLNLRLPTRSKQTSWRIDVAKKFMRSIDLRAVLYKPILRLVSLINAAKCKTLSTLANLQVATAAFRDQLKVRSQGLLKQSREAVKLSLRLRSVITETQLLSKFHWDRRVCIAVGAQGSVVYRVPESDADGTEGRSMAVKKIVLDDGQFSEMASGLKYSCSSKNDLLLRVHCVVIQKLSKEPTMWKLYLWTELGQYQSVLQQLPILRQLSLTDRMRVVLNVAEAIAQIHRDGHIHGNLRFSNIFIGIDDNSVKLSDVGQRRVTRLAPFVEPQLPPDLTEFPPEMTLTKQHQVGAEACSAAGVTQSADDLSVDAYCLGVLLKTLCAQNLEVVDSPVKTGWDKLVSKLIASCTNFIPDNRATVFDAVERLKEILNFLQLK